MKRLAWCLGSGLMAVTWGLNPAVGAPWISTGGPLGGLGYDVRIHPTDKQTMFVTDNYAGVIKSTDRGKLWHPSNAGITVRGGPSADAFTIFSLTIDQNDPRIVWAGTNGEGGAFGVFKSTDGGESWTLKTSGITDGGFGIVFRGFTVQTGNSSVVYAQAEVPTAVHGREFNRTQGRVYKSTNGGDSWSMIWSGADLARHLIIDPSNPSTLYLSTGIFDREATNSDCAQGVASAGGVGVLKSTDGGANWTPINSGLTDLYVGALRMHPTNPQILFAATGNNACSGVSERNVVAGLFRTTNGGTSWQKLIAGEIFTAVAFSPSTPNVVYAGTADNFRRSDDGGTTWQTLTRPFGVAWGPPGVRAGVPIDVVVDPDDPNLLYANNYGGGVFASSDGARTWQIWSRGYSGAEIHSLAVSGTSATVYAIGRSGPFVTHNHGLDWSGIANGDAVFPEWNSVAIQPGHPEVVVVADEHQGWLLRSADGGGTFSRIFHQPDADASMQARRQGFKALAFAPSAPTVVYAGVTKDRGTIDTSVPTGAVFYRSMDAGATFTSPSADLNGKNVHRFVVDALKANVVWAATSGGIYKSADSGSSWTLLGLSGKDVVALAVNPANANALVASVKNVGIFISSDGGQTWPGGPYISGMTNANPAVLALVFDPTGAALYAGDFYSGVYRSTDGGKNWAGFPDGGMTGLRMRAVKDLALSGGVLYAATQGGGVFRNGGPAIVPSPFEGEFGSVMVGAAASTRSFTIYNTGVAVRALSARALAGANAADFKIQNDTCGATLAPAASCTFDVVFVPSVAGARMAAVDVASDDPFGASVSIVLRGTALSMPPDAAVAVDAPSNGDGAPPSSADGGATGARIDAPVAIASDGGGGGARDGGAGTGGAGGEAGRGGSIGSGGVPGTGGSPTLDASSSGNPGPATSSKGGCGCSLGAAGGGLEAPWALVLLTAIAIYGRRRAR